MKGICKEELRRQYDGLETKCGMGFSTLWQNIIYLSQQGLTTRQLLGGSEDSFMLQCISQSGEQCAIKSFMVDSYTSLSSAIEFFENQKQLSQLSPLIDAYTSYYLNCEEEVMNLQRNRLYAHTLRDFYNDKYQTVQLENHLPQISEWISQLVETVSLFHERKYPLGAIKSSNIFLDNNEIRIVDVGFSLFTTSTRDRISARNIYALQNKNTINDPRFFRDVYALSIFIYQMVFGFECSYGTIKLFASGIPFQERDSNKSHMNASDYKFRVLKLMNMVVAQSAQSSIPLDISIFQIQDFIRNFDENSPHQNIDNPLSQEELLSLEKIYQQSKYQNKNENDCLKSKELELNNRIHEQENKEDEEMLIESLERDIQIKIDQQIDNYKKIDYDRFHFHLENPNPNEAESISAIKNQDCSSSDMNLLQKTLDLNSISPLLKLSYNQENKQNSHKQEEEEYQICLNPHLNILLQSEVLEIKSLQKGTDYHEMTENDSKDERIDQIHGQSASEIVLGVEDNLEDIWVLDFQDKLQVQRGDDFRPSSNEYLRNSEIYQPQRNDENCVSTNEQIGSMCRFLNHLMSEQKQLTQDLIENIIKDSPKDANLMQANSQQSLQKENEEQCEKEEEFHKQKQMPIYQENQSSPTCPTQLLYSNGQIMYEGEIIDGQRSGFGKYFNEQGQKMYEGQFEKDLFHGDGIEFYENGIVLHEGRYEQGKLCGLARTFYSSGVLCYEGQYMNGLCHGQGSKFSENNTLLSIGQYENGKMKGKQTKFYENGQIMFEGFFKNNKREGNAVEYHPNGVISFTGTYQRGKKVYGLEFDDSGNQQFEGQYDEDTDSY